MANVQLGILLDEELKDWFVNKCRTTRSTDASKRLLSAATVISAYLEHFREQDNINPWGIIPQLKDDSLRVVDEITPTVPTPTPLTPISPQSDELERLRSEVEALKALPTMDVISQLIESKITEVLARLKSEQLPNPPSISNSESNFSSNSNEGSENLEQVKEESNHNSTSDFNSKSNNDSNEQEIKSELEIESTITTEVEVVPELERSPVDEGEDLAGGVSGKEDFSVEPETPPETAAPPSVLPEAVETPKDVLEEELGGSPQELKPVVLQVEELSVPLKWETIKTTEDAINLWSTTKYGFDFIKEKTGIYLSKAKIVPNYKTEEEYKEIVSSEMKRPGKKA